MDGGETFQNIFSFLFYIVHYLLLQECQQEIILPGKGVLFSSDLICNILFVFHEI